MGKWANVEMSKCGNEQMWKWANERISKWGNEQMRELANGGMGVLYTYICIYWSEIWEVTGVEEKGCPEKFCFVRAICQSPLQKSRSCKLSGREGLQLVVCTLYYMYFSTHCSLWFCRLRWCCVLRGDALRLCRLNGGRRCLLRFGGWASLLWVRKRLCGGGLSALGRR